MTGFRNRMRRKIGQADKVLVQPLPVWFFGSDFVFQLRVIDDAPFVRVDE